MVRYYLNIFLEGGDYMTKKIISIIYIIFFAPFCINFIFPFMQLQFLGKEQDYYLTSAVSASNFVLLILSAIILLFSLFMGNFGQIHEILYYLSGIAIAVFYKSLYKNFYGAYFFNENLLFGILALGYLFVILCIIVGTISGTKSRMIKI